MHVDANELLAKHAKERVDMLCEHRNHFRRQPIFIQHIVVLIVRRMLQKMFARASL